MFVRWPTLALLPPPLAALSPKRASRSDPPGRTRPEPQVEAIKRRDAEGELDCARTSDFRNLVALLGLLVLLCFSSAVLWAASGRSCLIRLL